METLLFVLFNGFLFSISPSSVSTGNSANPVIRNECTQEIEEEPSKNNDLKHNKADMPSQKGDQKQAKTEECPMSMAS